MFRIIYIILKFLLNLFIINSHSYNIISPYFRILVHSGCTNLCNSAKLVILAVISVHRLALRTIAQAVLEIYLDSKHFLMRKLIHAWLTHYVLQGFMEKYQLINVRLVILTQLLTVWNAKYKMFA